MITILIGKSASGKDYTQNKLIEKGYIPIVSTTSRPMRINEVYGKEYYFTDTETFISGIINNEFLEYREYNTFKGKWYYGLKKDTINNLDSNNNYVVILDVNGAKSLIDYVGRDNVRVIYLDVDDGTRTLRAMKRGSWDLNEWNRRLKADRVDFSESKIKELGEIERYAEYNLCWFWWDYC